MQDLAEPRVPKSVKNAQMISHGDDSAIMAIFSDEFIKNEFESDKQGKAIYDRFIQISLEYPGNNLTSFSYRFRPEEWRNEWTERFPRQWEAFQAQKEQVPDGMPVELWAPLDKRRVLELKSMRIHTVEQIAALTDATGPNMGLDWRKLRDMAKATLEPNVGVVQVSRLTRENEDLKNKMEVLERQIASLGQAKTEDAQPRRGRPPKQVSTEAA